MSSKPLYIGLFIVAGLNLSFWGQPLHAEPLSRLPASSDCSIASELLNGQTDISCNRRETEFDREANSRIQSSTIYETGADGQKIKKGVSFDIITEANCDACNLSTGTETRTLVFGVDQLKDFNSVQQQILAAAEEQEEEALDKLKDEISLKKAVENCTRDESGDKLDEEEKFECRIEKMADMDDEEAEEYFNKHLKAELEKKALSSDPEERAAAVSALESIADQIYSEELNSKIEMMISASQQIDSIAAAKMNAQTKLAIAASLPDGHPQKQLYLHQAKEIMLGTEHRLQTLKINSLTAIGNSGNGAALKDVTTYFEKMELSLAEAYASSPELMALKAGTSTSTGDALNVNNSSRLQRGGTNVPGGLLTVIPKATVPANTSQTGLPNAHNLGRGTGQNRLPAPLIQHQIQPLGQVQPMPMPSTGYTYNQFQPMGPQFTGHNGLPVTVLPAM